MDNLSCVLVKKGQMELQTLPITDPAPNEVQIAIHSNGICASDVHKWTGGNLGTFLLTEPQTLGHEASGIITKVGSQVRTLKVGDRVALEAGLGCRYCSYCKEGRYNICEKFVALSLPGCSGTLANYINHPEDYTFKLADNVSLEEGALVEPLAIALHGVRRANVTIGSRVLITGAGTVGSMTLLLCKAMAATKIIITDLNEQKLHRAERIGATKGVLTRGKTNQQVAKEINQLTSIDITIECAGVNDCLDVGILATEPGGTVALVGILPDESPTNTLQILCKELNIIGCIAYANCYPLAIELLSRGQVDVKPLITHRYALRDVEKGFKHFLSGEGNPVKIVVKSECCPGHEKDHDTYLAWLKS